MITLSTGSLHSYGISRVFALAAEVGYDGIEVLIDGRWDSRDAVYLSRLSSDYNLPIVALHSPFVSDIQDWPLDQLGRLKRTVELANTLEARVVVAHLPLRIYGIWGQMNFFNNRRFMVPLPLLRRDAYYQFLHDNRLEEIESSSGVTVALENMPAHRFVGLTINAYWFNKLTVLPRFAHITLDTTHLGTWELDPVEVYNRLKQHVAHIHLSNFDGTEHRSPRKGHLALNSLLDRLAKDRYSGAISIETSPDALGADDEKKCRKALEEALAFCRENFALEE